MIISQSWLHSPNSGNLAPHQPWGDPWYGAAKQRSAFAMISLGTGANRRYLLQWNENWRMYNLIGGKMDNGKGDDNSFLRTICREIEEEIGLGVSKDCQIGQELLQLEMRQYSRREKRMKEYQFVVFDVALFPQLALNAQQLNNTLKWFSTGRANAIVSLAEIENLMTVTNKPISPTTHYILQELGHFPA
ncbi:MAG: NUDIX hydrolase [Chloroflexota bacterium]